MPTQFTVKHGIAYQDADLAQYERVLKPEVFAKFAARIRHGCRRAGVAPETRSRRQGPQGT